MWDLNWDLKKTISWEMGLGPPLHDPLIGLSPVFTSDASISINISIKSLGASEDSRDISISILSSLFLC